MRVIVLFDGAYASRTELHLATHPMLEDGDQLLSAIGDAEPVAEALRTGGHDADVVALDREAWRTLPQAVERLRPDIAFNLCDTLHGDSHLSSLVPGLLNALGLPFVGADADGLTITKRKHDVKALLAQKGLPTARYQVIETPADLPDFELHLVPPVILKLTAEHASVGIESASVVWTTDEVVERFRHLWERFHQPVLVEEYIDGRELYVSLAGDPATPLGMMEHRFDHFPAGYLHIRTFDAKWFSSPELSGDRPVAATDSRWQDPVPYRQAITPWHGRVADIPALCLKAFQITGCRDWGRIDVRIDRGGVPMIIDVTPNTYLGPSAPCAKAAAAAGETYAGLVNRILDGARSRAGLLEPSPIP